MPSPDLGGLVTYASGERSVINFLTAAEQDGLPVVVDSGAWSVFKGVATINLEEHAVAVQRIQKEHPEARCIALDVIGNPEQTRRNWLVQRNLGARVEPTLHYGTPPEQVDAYTDHMVEGEWLNLGGMAHLQRASEMRRMVGWIAAVMRRAPGFRFHALGAVTPHILDRLPLDAADSTYWKLPLIVGRRLSLYDERKRAWVGIACRRDSADTYRSAARHVTVLDSYGVTLRDWPDIASDDTKLLELSIASHRRLAAATRSRHNSAFTIYLAGIARPDLKHLSQ